MTAWSRVYSIVIYYSCCWMTAWSIVYFTCYLLQLLLIDSLEQSIVKCYLLQLLLNDSMEQYGGEESRPAKDRMSLSEGVQDSNRIHWWITKQVTSNSNAELMVSSEHSSFYRYLKIWLLDKQKHIIPCQGTILLLQQKGGDNTFSSS